jgi:hypothetical protein
MPKERASLPSGWSCPNFGSKALTAKGAQYRRVFKIARTNAAHLHEWI